MARKSIALVAAIGVALFGIVSGHHHQNHQSSHMCDANGDSSEECNKRAHFSNVLRAEKTEIKVRFFLHQNIDNPNESIELFSDDIDNIRKARPFMDDDAEWKILIPGFPSNGKSPFPNNVRDAYLQRMKEHSKENYNIIVVDWDRTSMCQKDTHLEQFNSTFTAVAGKKVAELLILMNDNKLLRLSKDVTMIGFSLGAHVGDEAARFVKKHYNKKNIIYRLATLDPISENFWPRGTETNFLHPRPLIQRSFVVFQDVYHTSSKYGMTTEIGDIDFFVNDARRQPGCTLGIFQRSKISYYEDLCAHVYATELFAKSINEEMYGCIGCIDLEHYRNKRCKCEDTPRLGEFADREAVDELPFAVGQAFISIGDLSNFGKRFETTMINAGEPKNNHIGWKQFC